MVEAKLLRKKLKNGLIVDKWDLVTIIEKQEAEIEALKAKTLTDEEVINIIERLIACWTDSFKNYEYNSDEPKENKLRDDVFAILRKAQEK